MYKNTYETIKKNIKLIDILRLNECIDKSSLANKLGVTWPTISTYVDELSEAHIISRNENGVILNSSYGYFWGISIGSAETKICIIDMSLRRISSEKFIQLINGNDVFNDQKKYMQEKGKGIEWYLYSKTPSKIGELTKSINSIFASIKKIVENHRDYNFIGIGVAFTGTVDRINKRIIQSHNLPCLDGVDFEEGILLRNHLDFFEKEKIHISLENNSTAAVIAEKWALYDEFAPNGEININQKYKHCQNVISIYLGAGLGLGIIQNNNLYRGSNDMPGGIGHLEVPNYSNSHTQHNCSDNTCACGNENCLDYRIRTDVFETDLDDFKGWDSEQIKQHFEDKFDKRNIMGKYLGFLINTLNNLLNPDLIIITGKLHKAIDLLWEAVQQKRNENSLKYTKSNCSLIKSQLGASAPSLGAAITAYYDCFGLNPNWDVYEK